MTWLLNQFQKAISAFRGRKAQQDSRQSSIADRLSADISSQRQTAQSDDTVALRQPLTPEEAASILQPSTPLSPAPTAPSAPQVDTHQRLDAAPAALSSTEPPPTPSFPTEVSELISSPLQSAPDTETTNDSSISTSPIQQDEQLPGIHDLLPAIEPDDSTQPEQTAEQHEQASADSPNAETARPPVPVDTDTAQTLGTDPAVASEEQVSTPEAVTLFSFDIIEAETNEAETNEAETELDTDADGPVTSGPEDESITQPLKSLEDFTQAIEAPLGADEGTDETALAAADRPGTESLSDTSSSINTFSVEEEIETMTEPQDITEPQVMSIESNTDEDQIEVFKELREETGSPLQTTTVPDQDLASTETGLTEPVSDSLSQNVENPWLLAKPLANAESYETSNNTGFENESVNGTVSQDVLAKDEQDENPISEGLTTESEQTESTQTEAPSLEPEQLMKKGVVKLLFTLKQGNFHGYIAPEDGSKDVLFHQKYINAEIFERLERGAQVMATVKHIEGKAYATHVELL
ncbi:MAG: cold shock domain-containing protein [Cyanobacteria bacterium J06626_6]